MSSDNKRIKGNLRPAGKDHTASRYTISNEIQ